MTSKIDKNSWTKFFLAKPIEDPTDGLEGLEAKENPTAEVQNSSRPLTQTLKGLQLVLLWIVQSVLTI